MAFHQDLRCFYPGRVQAQRAGIWNPSLPQQTWGPQECQWLSIAGRPSGTQGPPRDLGEGWGELEAYIVSCRSSYRFWALQECIPFTVRILNVNNHQEAQRWTQRSMPVTVPSPICWKNHAFSFLPSLICPNSIYCPSTDRCTDYPLCFLWLLSVLISLLRSFMEQRRI